MLSRSKTVDARNPGPDLAVVLRAFEGGGAQRDMILLCNALAAKGVQIVILSLRGEGPLRRLLDPSITVVEVPGGQIRYAIPGLRRVLCDLAPAAIISSEASLNLCTLIAVRTLHRHKQPKLVLREVGSPSIAQLRDPYAQNRIAYRVLRYLYRYADRIVALTEGARRDLRENFSVPDNVIAVMLTNAVIPDQEAERIARWDGETGREADLIVSVGRLSPEKDQRTLIRAMAMLPAELPSKQLWRLALVGDGAERTALEALVRDLGLSDRVVFTGQVADPFAWMMRARVAVCASVYEGLCNAIIEALACGTPVVSTNCPYGPFEILQGGRFGALTPVGDAKAMAKAIAAAMTDNPDRGRLRARGFDYTAARAADRFLEIIGELDVRPARTARPLAVASVS
ncbi:MAG TPA: glycosyltransferase [Xanthobacteraceae bacterium]|nr:glycosyltransferase [Xanthobacteraceae bacterium]